MVETGQSEYIRDMVSGALTRDVAVARLAQEAGLSPSTVSGHLDRLQKASLVAVERQDLL